MTRWRLFPSDGPLGSNVHAWIGHEAETELLPKTETIVGASDPMIKKTQRSARDGFGEMGLARGDAVLEEAAGG